MNIVIQSSKIKNNDRSLNHKLLLILRDIISNIFRTYPIPFRYKIRHSEDQDSTSLCWHL